ncbi:MAG: outer membrane lipoprotein carrier protein [Cognaticolwellia sp.]|jgi:outer membrane lipoprotein carrier protein
MIRRPSASWLADLRAIAAKASAGYPNDSSQEVTLKYLRPLFAAALLSLAAASPVLAEAPVLAAAVAPQNVVELVKAVEATYSNVEALSADFEQTSKSSAFELTMKGSVSLAKPRQMRWDTTSDPSGSLVVSDGEKLWMYLPNDKQVHVYQDLSTSASGTMAMDILGDLGSLDEKFETSMGEADAESYAVVLKPKPGLESSYLQVELVVAKSDYKLQKVILTDLFGGLTIYSFSNLKLNPELKKDTFTFVVPKGVEVIDPTKI